ncbi:MAG: DUF1343 domain-containing protein [Planctomycetes bacterium]|nr:DUF1343 domain-containing protein [Planctomycetota bacterium]
MPDGAGGPRIACGIDVLRQQDFAPLRGKKIGLITNPSGCDGNLTPTARLLAEAGGVRLAALFGPEHGIDAALQDGIHGRDGEDAIPVWSLYGERTRPTREMLADLDALVYDIQDAGVRFYTYITTLGECMQAAAEEGLDFYVLDRPDPLGGTVVAGPGRDPVLSSFVSAWPIPLAYGMTPGELAHFLAAEMRIPVRLTVIPMDSWRRGMLYDETGLEWIPPSPNLPTARTALVYPGTCAFEGTNLSEGRGTTRPFEWIGAPWIDGRRWADALNALALPGVRFRPIAFIPWASKHAGERCGGVQVHVLDPARFDPLRVSLEMLASARRLWPDTFQFREGHFDRLWGTARIREALIAGKAPADIVAFWQGDLATFRERRAPHLMYP